jgi:hypothetical protein
VQVVRDRRAEQREHDDRGADQQPAPHLRTTA